MDKYQSRQLLLIMAARSSLLLVGCLLSVSLVSAALSPPEGPKDTPTIPSTTTGVQNPAAAADRTITTGAPPNSPVESSTVSAPTASSVSTFTPGPATGAGETITTSSAPSSPTTAVPTTQSPATTGVTNTAANLTTTQSPTTTVIFDTTYNLSTTQSPITNETVNTTSVSPSQQPTEVPHTANTTLWVSTTSKGFNDTQGKGAKLEDSEKTLTVVFSVVLGVFVLGLVMYQVIRCHQRRVQYSHHPLTENTADFFIPDEDTLVISGGLYDGHVCEPITTQQDFDPDLSQPTQFRLEFLSDN